MTMHPSDWGRRATATLLGLWGVLHVVGGTSLVLLDGRPGLETLAPNAPLPGASAPLESVAAIIHFHGFNVAFGGLAVVVLVVWWAKRQASWRLWVAIWIATVLDVGLLAFLVAPGLLPAGQGLLGPVLLALAVTALGLTRRTAVSPLPDASP